jgi:hypothetical protein
MAKPKFKPLNENQPIHVSLKPFYEFAYKFDAILLSHYLTREQLAEKLQESIRTIRRKTKNFKAFTVGEIMDINTILADQRRKLKDVNGG